MFARAAVRSSCSRRALRRRSAHQLLADLNLDCDPKEPGRKAGHILFTSWGGHSGSTERWVDLKDDLSVSVLQARLIERDLPIKLVIGSL
jgi:hypothetical protein